MRVRLYLLAASALLSGCGEHKQPERRQGDAAHDIAMVERMNQVPFKPIQPQPFTGDDLKRYGLAGEGCAFRPGNDADAQPVFVAQHDRGYLKVASEVKPLAVKSGSAELPSGAHSTYVGLDNWIELVAQAGNEGHRPAGRQAWPSRLIIHDASQRIAYDVAGQVSCAEGTGKR